MHKLIVNPGTAQAWEIPLADGVTVLGSDPASESPIAHGTVSPAHCEIRVTDGAVSVKDLGSAGGTFINNEPIAEARLAPGQSLRLGVVELRLVSDAPGDPPVARRVPVSAAAIGAASAAQVCKYHPRAAATWHCGHCRVNFCDLCVNLRGAGETARHLCRKCGNDCDRVAVQYTVKEEKSFFEQLPGAFRFPFTGDGVVLLVAGTVFFTVIHFLSRYAGLFGLVLAIFAGGYLFSYTKRIVATTAEGSDVPPDWPDFNNWFEDILQPFGQMLALIVLAFGPAILIALAGVNYRIAPYGPLGAAPGWFDEYSGWLILASLAAGALFAPMGMLMLSMFDTLGALNPLPIIQSILRIPLHYLVAAGIFELTLAAYVVIGRLARLMDAPSLVTGLVMGFLELYTFSVGMRILGLLYRTNKERLGWFNN